MNFKSNGEKQRLFRKNGNIILMKKKKVRKDENLKNKILNKLNENQIAFLDTLIFLIKLLVFAIPLYIIMAFPFLVLPLQEIVKLNVIFLLQILGFSVLSEDFLIKVDDITFIISEDCTGWKSMLFMFALIFAVPKVKLKKRLMGLLFCVPVIYLGNLARIFLVIFVWKFYGFETAMMIHNYFWQAGLILLTLSLWLLWLYWVGKIKRLRMFLKHSSKIIKPR
ncbi:MAG: archaeosortase/exosortase family protein [Candidatus Aenigmatarchaeota archaeon]